MEGEFLALIGEELKKPRIWRIDSSGGDSRMNAVVEGVSPAMEHSIESCFERDQSRAKQYPISRCRLALHGRSLIAMNVPSLLCCYRLALESRLTCEVTDSQLFS